MARQKKRRKARSTNRSGGQFRSMMFGLIAGLGIAAIVWWQLGAPPPPAKTEVVVAEEAPAKTKPPKPIELQATGENFDFYEMLPEQEVVVHDGFAKRRSTPAAKVTAVAPRVTEQGVHRIQAGSFRNPEDADRMKGTLALQGMKPHIEPVVINGTRFNRVIIGPISELATLNEYIRRLNRLGLEYQVIRED
ncbi:MAG: SPOR domain-containing protein [Woeseiaceae bacterium]